MKSGRMGKALCLTALVISWVFSIGTAQAQQKAVWKGNTGVEHGIRVVRNPPEPIYGRISFDLQEELSIGNKNNSECSFTLISDVKGDSKGNIYVADTKNLRVQKFDRRGNFIESVGKGVVEFEQPSRIKIDPRSGYLFIRASVTDIEIFNEAGKYLHGIHPKDDSAIIRFEPIDKSHLLAVLSQSHHDQEPRVMQSLVCIGNAERRSVSPEFFISALEKVGEGWLTKNTPFDPELYFTRLDVDTYVYGYSKDYELTVIDKEGKVLYHIKKDEPRPTPTPQEKRAFKGSVVPELKPYFFHLLSDSGGRIYVQRNVTKGILNTVQEKTNREVDIFSKDGYFLYTSVLPPNTCEIRDGLLYAYAINEANRLETVKRYRIKNWEKIRTGI